MSEVRRQISGLPGQEPPVIVFDADKEASFLRKELQKYVPDLETYADLVRLRSASLIKGRGWTRLKRGDGKTFSSFQEFSETRLPYGLGYPFEKLDRFLRASSQMPVSIGGKTFEADANKVIDLATVAPASAPIGARDEKGRAVATCPITAPGAVMDAGSRKHEQARAILRAPEKAQGLVKAGLLSVKLAEKLGPKNPTATVAAVVDLAAREAERAVREAPGDVPKNALRKRVNAAVREALGEDPDAAIYRIALANARRLSRERQQQLVREIRAGWKAVE